MQTFVILGSPGILARKWCLGEMATARLSNVDSVLVSLPNFSLPDENFVGKISTSVPDILDLTTYGYGLSEVKATLWWLTSLRTIVVDRISEVSMGEMVGELTNTGNKNTNDMVLRSAGSCIVVDHENAEALASAHVLLRHLAPIMMDRGQPVMVLPPEHPESQLEQIQPTSMILVCSKQCFASPHIKACVLKARFLSSCAVLPVVCDDDFVPHTSPHTSAPMSQDHEDDDEAYRRVLAAVFLEVGLPFNPRTSSLEDRLP